MWRARGRCVYCLCLFCCTAVPSLLYCRSAVPLPYLLHHCLSLLFITAVLVACPSWHANACQDKLWSTQRT